MPDVVLDTNSLADFLSTFLAHRSESGGSQTEHTCLSSQATALIRRIRLQYESSGVIRDLVIASSLAFVEIARKWDDIVRGRFESYQFAAFLNQPPEWFSVAPMDEDLVLFFCEVPTHACLGGGILRAVEWTDAVHVATVISRGDTCQLVTTDNVLRAIDCLNGRLL